jgi:acyl carrier protein
MSEEMIAALGQMVATEILRQPRRVINPNEPLISSKLIDSMSLIDIALWVEDTYGVHFEDTELNSETFDTLDQLALLIKSRQHA